MSVCRLSEALYLLSIIEGQVLTSSSHRRRRFISTCCVSNGGGVSFAPNTSVRPSLVTSRASAERTGTSTDLGKSQVPLAVLPRKARYLLKGAPTGRGCACAAPKEPLHPDNRTPLRSFSQNFRPSKICRLPRAATVFTEACVVLTSC